MYSFGRILALIRMRARLTPALCFTAGMLALAQGPQAHAQVATQGENPIFRATITSVENSPASNGSRYLTTTIHIHNLTKQPLILGADPAKVSATDDQHNSYGTTLVRGIGKISGSSVDTKFVLPPEGDGDALFEMRGRADRNNIFGTTFDLTLPVRVILALEGDQYRLGAEHLTTFSGLKPGYVAQAKESQTSDKNTVDAGPFTMQITRVTPSVSGRWQVATLAARIRNTSSKPIVLAYESDSSFGVDDQGTRYAYGVGGSHDTSVSGIGMVTSSSADPQLTLAPGESRDVQFRVIRSRNQAAGRLLTYYVALAQLEILPGNQIRTVRQYSLTFPRLPGLN